jgi:hypothetical protein
MGLDALCRAVDTDYFGDGHRGAAIMAAYWLCEEQPVDEAARRAIAALVDAHYAATPLCAPLPEEQADPSLLGEVEEATRDGLGRLRQAAHNLIFAATALKAFDRLPERVTPRRVDGIRRLLEAFETGDDFAPVDDAPPLSERLAVARFVLEEWLRCVQRFLGRGQGWSGHMLTSARAVFDLAEGGRLELADAAYTDFRRYVARARSGPDANDREHAEREPFDERPLEGAYWKTRRRGAVGLGHCFKYPYGFYGLLSRAEDADLERRCSEVAFRIF